MLLTKKLYGINVGVSSDSSMVTVFPGMVQVDTTVFQYRGENLPFSSVVTVSDASNLYKNSLLYITDSSSGSVQSDATNLIGLVVPQAPAHTFPVAVLTFYSSDGSSIQVVDWDKINR